MSTNFYWHAMLPTGKPVPCEDNPELHIGKRSGAGGYCFDCGVTLCVQGESVIHDAVSKTWHKECPKCKQKSKQTNESEPKGVGYACSFSWAQEPQEVLQICEQNLDKEIIQDEYYRLYTGSAFLDVLKWCPIYRTQHIGMEFC